MSRDRASGKPLGALDEEVGDRRGDSGRAELVDRLVDVGKQRRKLGRRSLHGIGDEGERASAERGGDQLGRDVEDPVSESGVRPGRAVVRLVGMEDVELARQADPALAAVVKALDARGRDANSVGVVAMRFEAHACEKHLGALDPRGRGPEPDAGSFKTVGIDAS